MRLPVGRLGLFVSLASLVIVQIAAGEDWTGFRGPRRDGKSSETGLLASWLKDGPKLELTIKEAGAGLSGMAVVGDRLFTMGQREDGQYTLCFSLKDGKLIWARKNGAVYSNSFGDGPRCTPTIDGDFLYVVGAHGDLQCLFVKDGSEKWKLNILEEFGGKNIGWGISESPLVDGDRLIVTPGGTGGTMVALDKTNGRAVWRARDPNNSGSEPAAYASPQLIQVGDLREIVNLTSKGAIGVRAKDGQFLWRYDQVANGTANCSSPVYSDGKILYSSDYGTGCALLELKPDGSANELYFNKNLKSHHGGYVLVNGFVYGCDSGVWVCMEWNTGNVKWKERGVGKGSVVFADGILYALSENGVMGLVRAAPTAYEEISRFSLPQRSGKTTWVYPVISNGKLFLRDQENIFSYDIKAK